MIPESHNIMIRDRITEELKRNIPFFKLGCLNLVNKVQQTPFRVVLDGLSWKYAMQDHSIDFVKCVNDFFELNNDIKLAFRVAHDDSFETNEIRYHELRDHTLDNNFDVYRIKREILEYECESEYWSNENYVTPFAKIAQFPAFKNTQLEGVQQLNKYLNKGDFYFHEGWLQYFYELVEYFFKEYKFNAHLSWKGIKRFTKEISSEYLLCLEYDENEITSLLRKGDIDTPELNLVLIRKDARLIKHRRYIYEENPDYISMGIAGNPMFYFPCFPLINFASVDMYHDPNNPANNNDPMYQTLIEWHDGGVVHIVHPEKHGETLKKHAYFYMHLLSLTGEPYMEYIEKSIRNALHIQLAFDKHGC